MKRILFVEDNEMLLELYGMLLDGERNSWQTTLAPDGETALKLLQQTAFDVVASASAVAGFARSLVRGPRRRPSPPARTMTRTRDVSKGPVLR